MTSRPITHEPLVQAAVSSAVAEKAKASVWETVAFVATDLKLSGHNSDQMRTIFRVAEAAALEQMKAGATLGPAWRTAKSVALTAARIGVPLTETLPTGKTQVRPKSVVDADIRATRTAPTTTAPVSVGEEIEIPSATPWMQAHAAYGTLTRVWPLLTSPERQAIKAALATQID